MPASVDIAVFSSRNSLNSMAAESDFNNHCNFLQCFGRQEVFRLILLNLVVKTSGKTP